MRTELDALKGERTGHVGPPMDSFFEDFLPAAIEEFSHAGLSGGDLHYRLVRPDEAVPQLLVPGRFDVGMTFVGRLPAGIEARRQPRRRRPAW